jgi:hypothetical protein
LNWATRFISPEGKESRLSLRMLAKLDVEKAGHDTKPSAEHVRIAREVCKNRLLQQRLFARMGERIVTRSWNSQDFSKRSLHEILSKAGTNDDDIRAEEFAGY